MKLPKSTIRRSSEEMPGPGMVPASGPIGIETHSYGRGTGHFHKVRHISLE